MAQIQAKAKSVWELLSGAKYAIDYYQREYRWETKQVAELIEDLTGKFLDDYEDGHGREAVKKYANYFLGSIIISNKEEEAQRCIVDGQQRLTTLTLLLIFLQRSLLDQEHRGQVAQLIFSLDCGTRSFNLEVDERTACMEALYAGEPFDETEQPESVKNIIGRSGDISELFPKELGDSNSLFPLPHFTDWLMRQVYLVEITAYSDSEAYAIFETMNDRGLSLTPTDMLKGHLLTNITDTKARTAASRTWKERISKLQSLGKDEDADAIKTWLRSQHADSIRERKRNAVPRDFDLIGTEFHRWVKSREPALGLTNPAAFGKFIERDFAFYSRIYRELRQASWAVKDGLECVLYNAHHNFTLQYPVLLAPIGVEDGEAEVRRKLRVVASYLDILIARRIWNFRSTAYSTMQYAMFVVMKDIRRKSAEEVAELLTKRLADEGETFSTNERFHLHGQNRRQIKRLLARITDYVDTRSGGTSRYLDYINAKGKKAYEVEHIWADHAEDHEDEFAHPTDFQEHRNRIGGLLLVPKSFNASYGDLPYDAKRKHYNSQNLLARTLCDEAYERNPGFLRFVKESGLPIRAHADFKKADLEARQALYVKLAEQIWDPNRLAQDAKA